MGTCPSEHPDHRKELSRINRISGQLDGIKKMIEDRRYCPEVLTQLQAVRGALKSLEGKILKTHMEACVRNAFASFDDHEKNIKITELIDIFVKRVN